MAVLKTASSGDMVTIGSGYPTMTTWGERVTVPDPGIPLDRYSVKLVDPLKIWKSQPSVRKVVGFAARAIAAIPFHAYRRIGDHDRARMASSPVERILRGPDKAGLVSGYHLLEVLTIDRMLYDIALAVLIDDELVRVPPRLIRVASDFLGRPRQVKIKTPQGMDDIDVTAAPKILMFGWHADRAGGVSPMETLSSILDENARAVAWRRQQWVNSPKLSGVLKMPAAAKKWETEQEERFKEDWRTWRDSNAGGTPILKNGMEYQELKGITPKDAKDIEGRMLTDVEVASSYHIAPEMVGAREGTFSNVNAFKDMLYGPSLGPAITETDQAINIGGIIPALDVTPDLYIEANREAAMAGSFLEQIRYLQTATGAPFMTRAEARARLNLPHIAGTEDIITPLNVLEGGQASPNDTGNQNLGGDNADPDARTQ